MIGLVRKIARKVKASRHRPPEARARRTEDFTRLYKQSADPWNLSRRVGYYRDVWEWIFRQLPAPVESVVDAGCGVGAFLKALAELRPDVYAEGIEFSERAAQAARQSSGLIIHTGDLTKPECFRACRAAALVTLNDVLYYLPGKGAQGVTNCLRYLRPSYLVISESPADNEDVLTPYEHSYWWDAMEASLIKIAASTFDLPKELGWLGKHPFALYQVIYETPRANSQEPVAGKA